MVYFTETRPIVVVSGGALDERVGTAYRTLQRRFRSDVHGAHVCLPLSVARRHRARWPRERDVGVLLLVALLLLTVGVDIEANRNAEDGELSQ